MILPLIKAPGSSGIVFENGWIKSVIMKKLRWVLLVAVFCFFVIDVHAQITTGVKAGFNFARLSGFDGNSRVSGHVGLFLNHRINSLWSFQPELLYSGEGQLFFREGEERTIALGYINVPLIVQYYPARQLYFEFGPQLGFLVSAEDKGRGNDIINAKSDFRSTQIALDLGVGVQATNRVGFYGRYNFGLTDVSLFDDIVDHSLVGQIGMTIRLQ